MEIVANVSFLGPGNEEKRYGTNAHKPEGRWDHANQMIEQFQQSGHPVFRDTKCVHPIHIEAKIRKKHYSLHSGLREHRVNAAHHSLCKSAQFLRSSVELVHRLL